MLLLLSTAAIVHDRFYEFVARLKAVWTKEETLYLVCASFVPLLVLPFHLACSMLYV